MNGRVVRVRVRFVTASVRSPAISMNPFHSQQEDCLQIASIDDVDRERDGKSHVHSKYVEWGESE